MREAFKIAALILVTVAVLLLLLFLVRCNRPRMTAIDPFATGKGADGGSKISSIINDPVLCPYTGQNVGCVIDAQNPQTQADMVWQINPFHGANRKVVLLLGPHTYVACVPIVSGQSGYMITGVNGPALIPGGTRIRPGSAADGCPGTFPNGKSIQFTYPHGLYPAGSYNALYNDCGDTQNDSPVTGTGDCFGGRIEHVQFDAASSDTNPVAVQPAANFLYYSSAVEERGGLFDVSLKNCITACAFLDRNNQMGPPSPGGSGPVHFAMRDIVMTERTDGLGDLKTDGLVMELNTTRLEYNGQSGCSETTTPAASGNPTAYITFNNGNPDGSAVVTNGGNCKVPPSGCTFYGPGKSAGATCSLVLTDGNKTPVLSTTIHCVDQCAQDHNYPRAAVPGGGPLIERVTIAGSDTTHRFRYAIAVEGDRDTEINHIHTERIGDPGINPGSNGDTILHGFGTAPYSGGVIMAVNTTSGPGGCVHQGVGGMSSDVSMIDVTREISSGCVIVDDNVLDSAGHAFTLSTTDTPSHRRVPFYDGHGAAGILKATR